MTSTGISGISAEVPESVSKAIEAFGQGELSLLDVRQCITLALEEDPTRAEPIHEALDEELKSRTLTIGDYGELVSVVGAVVSENVPTECSEDAPDESGVYRVVEEGTLVPTDLSEWPEFQDHVAAGAAPSERTEHTRPFGERVEDLDAAHSEEAANKVPPVGAGSVLRERFRLDEEVARGAMGVVYRATDLMKLEAGADDPQLAVKLVSPEIADNKITLRAFQNEVANTQHLSHPNIISVFELDRDNDQYFITMEWLAGQSLALLLDSSQGSALQPTQTYAIIEQLCDALIYAHEHNVVHADVKPGNVFLVETGEVKLIDFGIAHNEEELASSSASDSEAIALTPAYASCERLEEQLPTAQDDLYSLACLIYRLLAGRRVFGPLTALEAEAQAAEAVRIGGMDDRRWNALSKALSFRRTDRQASVKEFSEEFGRRSHIREEATAEKVEPPVDDTARMPVLDAASVDAAVDIELPPNLEVDFPLDEEATEAPEPELSGMFQEAALRGEAEDIVLTSEPEPVRQPFKLPSSEQAQVEARSAKAGLKQKRLAGGALAAAIVVALVMMLFGGADEVETPRVVRTPELAPQLPAVADAPVVEAPEPAVAEAVEEAVEVPVDETFEVPVEETIEEVVDEPVEASEPVVAEVIEEAVEVPVEGPIEEPAEVSEPVVAEVIEEAVEVPVEAPIEEPTEASEAVVADVAEEALEEPVVQEPVVQEPVVQEPVVAAPPPPDSVALSELEFIEYTEPKFPRSGTNRRYDGWVDVNFQVRADGLPRYIEVVETNLPGKFEAASIEAVEQWRFAPYLHEGTPIAVNSAVRLRFAN